MSNDVDSLPLFQYVLTDYERRLPPEDAKVEAPETSAQPTSAESLVAFPFQVGDWVWVAPFLGSTQDAKPGQDGYRGRKRLGKTQAGVFRPAPRKIGPWTTNHFVPRRLRANFGDRLAQVEDLSLLHRAGVVFVNYPDIAGMTHYGVPVCRCLPPANRPRHLRSQATTSLFCEFYPSAAASPCWVQCFYFAEKQRWASSAMCSEPRQVKKPNEVYFHVSWLAADDERLTLPDGSFTLEDYRQDPNKYLSPRKE